MSLRLVLNPFVNLAVIVLCARALRSHQT
ncbi:hypothetical protein OCEANICA350_12807 [Oceanicaulis sp. 350]|nr:hypothetical protein OCEANICA350_12807 [Oceanicaulis sp. 350]